MPELSNYKYKNTFFVSFFMQMSHHNVYLGPVSDLAPGQMGMDDMKMLEQKAQQLSAEAERDKPKEKILFVRFVFFFFPHSLLKIWKEILYKF